MKKRIIAFLMALVMCMSLLALLAACDDTDGNTPSKTKLDVAFASKTFVYDGTPKSIYVTGDLPDDVKVSYVGNEQVHVGVYAVVATFSSDNDTYELPQPMTATLTITSATGGEAGGNVTDGKTALAPVFLSQGFVYDGTPKSIFVTNIPADVTVSYTGNGQINVGNYTVTATFFSDNDAYILPDPISVPLIINPKPIQPKFESAALPYNASAQSIYATEIPEDVTVTYTGNGQTQVGTYSVTATFSSTNPNYALPDPITRTLTIYILTDEYGRELDDLSADLNYLGVTVNMLYWSDVERLEFNIDRITGDNISDAIFDRDNEIERRLNVTLEYDSTPGNVSNRARFVQKVQNDADSGARKYDLIATYSRTAGMLAMQGYLWDLNEIQNSHINLEKPWYPARLAQTLAFGDSLYMLSGDMSTNLLHQMHVLYFNKETFSTKYNELATGLGFTGDSDEGISPACQMLYEYAYYRSDAHPQGSQWTIHRLIDFSSGQYKDLNGNGMDENDQYGFCSTAYHVDSFYTGANLRLVEQVDDDRILIISPDYGSRKTGNLVSTLGSWLTTDSCFVQRSDSLPFTKPFEKGNAFFVTARAHYAEQVLMNVDFNYGILPMPKYTESQVNYYTCLGNPFSIYGIYRYHGNKSDWDLDNRETLSMLTAVLECWASEGYRLITPEIFEVNMQLKYADTQYETDMFEYARSNVTFDLGRIFANDLSFMSELPSNAACNGAGWASVYGQYKDSLEDKMELITDEIRKNQ